MTTLNPTHHPKRNIMRRFEITELSAVDRPAQVHARVALVKRADEQQEHCMRVGKIGREEVMSFDNLDEAIAYLERQGMSSPDAMSAAAREHPGLLAKYQSDGEQQVAKARERMRSPTPSPAVGAFERLVDQIEKRDGCSGIEALRRARAEDPRLFERYRSA